MTDHKIGGKSTKKLLKYQEPEGTSISFFFFPSIYDFLFATTLADRK